MRKLLYALRLISTNLFAQKFVCDNPAISDVYKLALNTVDINTRRGMKELEATTFDDKYGLFMGLILPWARCAMNRWIK